MQSPVLAPSKICTTVASPTRQHQNHVQFVGFQICPLAHRLLRPAPVPREAPRRGQTQQTDHKAAVVVLSSCRGGDVCLSLPDIVCFSLEGNLLAAVCLVTLVGRQREAVWRCSDNNENKNTAAAIAALITTFDDNTTAVTIFISNITKTFSIF